MATFSNGKKQNYSELFIITMLISRLSSVGHKAELNEEYEHCHNDLINLLKNRIQGEIIYFEHSMVIS